MQISNLLLSIALSLLLPTALSLLSIPASQFSAIPASQLLDPSLYPHTSNGYLGVVTQTPAIYVKSLFTQELEWLEAACLALSPTSPLAPLLNPLSRYELSGLCGKLDSLIMEDHPDLDVIEKGYGARKARLQNPFAYKVKGEKGDITVEMDDDTATATLTSPSTTRTYYAHSTHPSLYVHTLSITSPGLYTLQPIKFRGLPDDVTFSSSETFKTPSGKPAVCNTGYVNLPEHSYPSLPPAESFFAVCHHVVPDHVRVKEGEAYDNTLVYAVETSREEINAESCKAKIIEAESDPSLRSSHVSSWSTLNLPTIQTSNETLNSIITSTLTSIRSSVHLTHPYPPSPGGTSTNGYFGLFFWDSDTWISSSLLLLNPTLAQQSSLYRINHIPHSRLRASEYGHEGCMVPWQSGGGGHDLSLAPFGNVPEQHVTSSAVMLIQNIERLAGKDALTQEFIAGAHELVTCAGDFWLSRLDSYGSISGVVGPDEFGNGGVGFEDGRITYKGVTDNPYTNVGARKVLEYAFGVTGDDKYREGADRINVLYDGENDMHPQYVDFPSHQNAASKGAVKQADVTMMAWPLDYKYETNSTLLNDLEYYKELYTPEGPGMTESISTIGWLKAGDIFQARSTFLSQLSFVQPQFNLWTETPDPTVHPSDMGCYNFLTGAGGFIQSLIHGYGGFRFMNDGGLSFTLTLDSELFTTLEFKSITYRGNTITVRGSIEDGVEVEFIDGEGGVGWSTKKGDRSGTLNTASPILRLNDCLNTEVILRA